MNFYGIVYKATNIVNGKCYIGQTTYPFKERIKNHKISKDDCYFHRAIRKHGFDNFQWETIKECCSRKMLNFMETYMIMINKSHITQNGYNMSWGGDGNNGYHHTEETKKKMRESGKIKIFTDEHKMNLSKSAQNRVFTKQHKENLKKNSFNKGKSLSKETINKIKLKRAKQIITDEHKKNTSESMKKVWDSRRK